MIYKTWMTGLKILIAVEILLVIIALVCQPAHAAGTGAYVDIGIGLHSNYYDTSSNKKMNRLCMRLTRWALLISAIGIKQSRCFTSM